jgi:Tol biopolymer transport system component
MSQQFRISDAQLERLLRARAAGPDLQLLGDIVAMTEQRRQRRGLLAGLAPMQRQLLLLATVALLLAALVGAIAVGSRLLLPEPIDFGEAESLIISRDECGLIGIDPATGQRFTLWQGERPCDVPHGRNGVQPGPATLPELLIAAAASSNEQLVYSVSPVVPGQESPLIGLWRLEHQRGGARYLGECVVVVCVYVDVSVGGERIVHAGWDGTAEGAYRLAVTDSDGAPIWSRELDALAYEPRFAPDGSHLLFSGYEDGLLYVIDADGSGQRPIFEDADLFVRAGSWSPDGSRVAFTTLDRATGEFALWVMESAGDGLKVASLEGGQVERHVPVWSPDGTHIAYARRTDGPRGGGFEVWVVREDGSDARQVYADCCQRNTIGSVPAWSSDGEWVAFAASREDANYRDGRVETPGLYLVRPDGSELHRVADISIQPFLWLPVDR